MVSNGRRLQRILIANSSVDLTMVKSELLRCALDAVPWTQCLFRARIERSEPVVCQEPVHIAKLLVMKSQLSRAEKREQ